MQREKRVEAWYAGATAAEMILVALTPGPPQFEVMDACDLKDIPDKVCAQTLPWMTQLLRSKHA